MNRIVGLVWGGAALVIAYNSLFIALSPKGDASGWVLALGFAIAAGYCAWQAWRNWKERDEPGANLARLMAADVPLPVGVATDYAGAWRGDPIPLETQIDALKDAGLLLAPDRRIDELLISWTREQYETDPYGLILFMYGSDVEAEPWERGFCERAWNFDMECLVETGDYVHAIKNIVRITGQPNLATNMSDTFRIDADACEIRYTIDGRERVLKAKIDNDWADPEAVVAFARDIEVTIGDGRRFWASDNGQASILFFLTDAEASKVNALRKDVLARYVAA